MTGSHQKCSGNVDSKHVVDSRLACEGEAKENNARYFSYEDANKLCSHSTTCSPIRTVWAWNIFIRITGTRLCLHFTYIYIYILSIIRKNYEILFRSKLQISVFVNLKTVASVAMEYYATPPMEQALQQQPAIPTRCAQTMKLVTLRMLKA